MQRLAAALLAIGLLAGPWRARGDEDRTNPAADAPRPARPGDHGFLLLEDGSTLLGTFRSSDERGDEIDLDGGTVIRLPRGAVKGLSDRAVVPARPQPQAPADGEAWILLQDGRRLRGRITARDADGLSFDGAAGTQRVAGNEIDRIVWIGTPVPDPPPRRVAPAEPARVRYLSVPTALQPDAREVTLSVVGLERPEVGLGLTRFLSLAIATTLPVDVGSGVGANAAGRLQAGMTWYRVLHVAAGLQVSADRTGSVGLPFATFTWGTPGSHLSAHVGPPPLFARRRADLKDVALGLGAGWRAWSSLALVAESWVGETAAGGTAWTAGAAARWSTGRFDLDAGLLRTPAGTVPWLSACFGIR